MKNRIFSLFLCIVIITMNGVSVSASVKKMPDGTEFDAEYYASTYPDVAQAVGTDEQALYNHYVQYGKAEGRKAKADGTSESQATTPSSQSSSSGVKKMSDGGYFDAGYYAANNPDVVAAVGSSEAALYKHYVSNGKAEGRQPFAPGSVSSPVVLSNRTIKYVLNFKGIQYPTLTITNNSGKTIKYVDLVLSPTNTFGDVVHGANLNTEFDMKTAARYTGPLESGKSATPSWQAWVNSTITSFIIVSASVEYTDGTKQDLDLSIAVQ